MSVLTEEADPQVLSARPKLKQPPKYQVVLLNDDYTPMEFVVDLLQRFFGMTDGQAQEVMFQVHTQGRSVCGVYTRDVAETKVKMVNDYSQQHEQPLLCLMEPAG